MRMQLESGWLTSVERLAKRVRPRAGAMLAPSTFAVLLSFMLAFVPSAQAQNYQFHYRTGMLQAMLGGAKGVEPFSTMPIMDGEFEYFSGTKTSHLAHLTFASEMATAQTKYFYVGYGRRTYVWGTTGSRIQKSDGKGFIEAFSTKRYYVNWEAGIGQAQAQVVNLSLNLTSTVFEAGGAAGMIWQMGDRLGMVGQFGLGYGYGFSSVAVSGIFARILFGATYSY